MFEVVTGPMHCGKTEFVVGEIIRASIASRKRNKQKAILVFTPLVDARYARSIEDQIKNNCDKIKPFNNPPNVFREVDAFSKFWNVNNPGFSTNTPDPLLAIFKVKSLSQILEFFGVVTNNTPRNGDTPLVVIDETQFYHETATELEACYGLWRLANRGVLRLIASGLNTDFAGRPFVVTSTFISLAREKARCLSAVCDVCGEEARFTQRLVNGNPAAENAPRYVVGDAGSVGADKYEYQARCENCWRLGPSVVRKENQK